MRAVILLLLLLGLVGCARPPQPVWTDIPEAQVLLERLTTRSGQAESLDLDAVVSLTREGRFYSSQQFMLVQSPDRLRIDALTGFGQLILQLATDGEMLSVFMNTTVPPRFYLGEASQENFARFVQMPLPVDLLVPLLLYDPPVMPHGQSRVVIRDNQLALVLEDRLWHQIFYFDGQLQLTGMDYEQGGEKRLLVRYSRFSPRDDFPRRIEMDIPAADVQVALRVNDAVLNPDIGMDRFRLQVPPDTAIELLP